MFLFSCKSLLLPFDIMFCFPDISLLKPYTLFESPIIVLVCPVISFLEPNKVLFFPRIWFYDPYILFGIFGGDSSALFGTMGCYGFGIAAVYYNLDRIGFYGVDTFC